MRNWGFVLLAVGIFYLLYAFNMEVSISTSSTYIPGYGNVGGGDVVNLDLMERRRNHLIVASLITLIGAMMAIFGKSEQETSSVSANHPDKKDEPPFEGQRDLNSDAYRLWLADRYDIQRNEVFEKFVLGDRTFANLDAALSHAHETEERAIRDEIADREAAAERSRIAKEEEAERIKLATEAAEAEWQEAKPKMIVGFGLLIVVFIGVFLITKESPEEREARLAEEEAERRERFAEVENESGVTFPEDAIGLTLDNEMTDVTVFCDGITSSRTVEFDTTLSEDALRDYFSDQLGEGLPKYEYVEDSGSWKWSIEGREYSLSSFSGGGTTSAYFCFQNADEN